VETFFSSCLQIRDLRLEFFDFGDDHSSLTPAIMDGFVRLDSLEVVDCYGNLVMFAELAPIQNLSKLTYNEYGVEASESSEIISAFAMKYRSLKSIHLYAFFDSWESIHKVAECCRNLEEISLYDFSGHLPVKASEFVEIASLARLKRVDLSDCVIDDEAVSLLVRCMGLRHLIGVNIMLSSDVPRAIGGNLMTLQCKLGLKGLEKIVEFCPNLENLDIRVKDEEGNRLDNEARMSDAGLIKRGLIRLTKLKINYRTM
jgi:hypothetical protein